MDLDILVVGLMVVFLVLAILYVTIEVMHFIISRIETNRKARQAYLANQSEQGSKKS